MLEMLFGFLIGLCSGFVGAIATGGGLISIPGLILLGLSPVVAIATTRLSSFSSSLSSLVRFHKERLIKWKTLLPLLALAAIGGIAGSNLLLGIDEDTLLKLVGALLLLMLPLLVMDPKFGTITKHRSQAHHRIGYVVLFIVCVYCAMFGGGGGIFMLSALIYFFGMTVIQANAHGAALNLVAMISSIIYFSTAGSINFKIGIPLMIGAALGGYFGAHTAIKKGNSFVRIVLIIIVTVSGLKLLLS